MKHRNLALTVWLALILLLAALALLVGSPGEHQDIREAMRDAVLHDVNRVSLFGLLEVNPALISAFAVTGLLLLGALALRLFALPRFRTIPGRFQLLLEQAVGFLDGLARASAPGKGGFAGAYLFAAGLYIFFGTLFVLLGVQVLATSGHSVALPAPLSDINAAICMGCQSFLVLLGGGLAGAGFTGVKRALKEFSLPISVSFRLFGALLSGLLVTELVYHYLALSFVLPVLVGLLFTALHAIIQTYVLCMLVGMYFHEVSEPIHQEKTEE